MFGASLLWLALLRTPFGADGAVGASGRFDPLLRKRGVGALALLLVLFLGQRTMERIPDWQSDRVLFGRAVERDPLYREGYYVLAVDRFEAGDFGEAKRHISDLQNAEAAFGDRSSFFRKQDALRLLCKINLAIELADDSEDSEGLQPEDRASRLRACYQREDRRQKVRKKLRETRRAKG